MAYSAPIDRQHPTAFLFLVDQSGSMADQMDGNCSKADIASNVMNRTLMDLIIRSTKADGVRDYFHVGIIGYGGHGVSSGFTSLPNSDILHPVSLIEENPLRVEDRTQRVSDGIGGLVEQSVRFPVWFDPVCMGGTPMCEALFTAAETLAAWCDAHPDSYPPTVLHITDGESNDAGSPEELAKNIMQIGTNDGQTLMFNLHISTSNPNPVRFPATDNELPDAFARMLFNMSSTFPERMRMYAQAQNLRLNPGARGFAFNAGLEELVDLFDIGTRAMQLR